MKLLLDEDSLGRAFVRLLQNAGHDVETVTGIGMSGSSDADVFAYAKLVKRVVLTRNTNDFLALHQADSNHCGVIVEYQDADRAKNMSSAQVVTAIRKLETSGWNLTGQFVAVNEWR